jgi:hypothetical protein
MCVVLLGGCRLVDQRTFESAPTAPEAAAMTHTNLPPLPLIVVTPAIPDSDWRGPLAQAVEAARARKPDVTFEVVTPIPTSANRSVQDDFMRHGQDDQQVVDRELQADGVPPERITPRFQGDPGAPPREVRLYAR